MWLIWLRVREQGAGVSFFFPLLLFALCQEVQLRYPNTMLECGLTLVTLVTTYGYLRFREGSPWLACALAGSGAFVAFLCKGPVGLFPLALPFLYTLVRERRFSIRAAAVPMLVAAGCFGLLFLLEPAALDFMIHYLKQQVVAGIQGERIENQAVSRFAFLRGLVVFNLPGLVLSGLLLFVRARTRFAGRGPRKSELVRGVERRRGLAFLVIGASAILPLAVSIKQASYYQIPSLPYFYLGLSLLLLPRLEVVVAFLRRRPKWNRVVGSVMIAFMLFSVGFALSMLGTTDRRDVVAIQQAVEIDRVMDSLGVDTYQLIVTGERRRFDQGLTYTVAGMLNRFHAIYQDHDDLSPVGVVIRTPGGEMSELWFKEVLYQDKDLMFGRLASSTN